MEGNTVRSQVKPSWGGNKVLRMAVHGNVWILWRLFIRVGWDYENVRVGTSHLICHWSYVWINFCHVSLFKEIHPTVPKNVFQLRGSIVSFWEAWILWPSLVSRGQKGEQLSLAKLSLAKLSLTELAKLSLAELSLTKLSLDKLSLAELSLAEVSLFNLRFAVLICSFDDKKLKFQVS